MPHLAKDPALLAAFRRGERAALERVYWHYIDRIERVVRHGFHLLRGPGHVMGARPDEVADLVQETFARAFTERARLAYDGIRDYAPFLTTIARNLLADRARRLGRELQLPEDWEEPAVEEEIPFADDRTMRAVREYLTALSDELRGVHEKRYVRGLSQEEAASQLGLTRQRLRTLEKKLRQGLAAHMERLGIRIEEDQPAEPEVRMEKEKAT